MIIATVPVEKYSNIFDGKEYFVSSSFDGLGLTRIFAFFSSSNISSFEATPPIYNIAV